MEKATWNQAKTGDKAVVQAELKDMAMWRWLFYARSHGLDPSAHLAENWLSFIPVLNDSVEWAGGWERSKFAQPKDLPHNRHLNIRLASLPWPESGETLRSLEARQMLDIFYVQAGVLREGAVVPEDVSRLKASLWQAKEVAVTFLGQAACLWVEVGRIEEGEAGNIARRMLESWSGGLVRQVEILEFDFGFVGLPAGLNEEVWVLLVWDTDEARAQADELVNRLLPPLFLARLKGRVSTEKSEQGLLPAAHKLEGRLSRDLKRIAEQPRRLKILEEACYSISQHQAELAENMGRCEEALVTLRVNAENLDRLLSNPLLASHKTSLDAWLAAPLRLQLEQIETDLRYLTITQTQGDRVLHGIETLTGVRTARWERAIAILFGLFVALGAAQVFPERPDRAIFLWRTGISVATVIPVLIIIWWLNRRSKV